MPETNTTRIIQLLERDGWFLSRHGSNHDIYRHADVSGIIVVPRHRTLSVGVARSIEKKAGWLE